MENALQADGRVVRFGCDAQGQCEVPCGLGSVTAVEAGCGTRALYRMTVGSTATGMSRTFAPGHRESGGGRLRAHLRLSG